MRATRQLLKAKDHIGKGLTGRVQHTGGGTPNESTSGRIHSESFQQASSRVPWGTLTGYGTIFGAGWGAKSLSQSETFRNIDLTDLWTAPAIANSFLGQPSWLPAGIVGSSMGHNFLADAAAKAMPAVVNINHAFTSNQEPGEQACGSGFVVDMSGLVVTNAHVVEAAVERQHADRRRASKAPLRVVLQDGRSFDGEVVSIDRLSDLALVKVDAREPLPTAKMGSSGGMRVGEWVLALGSPLTLQNSVTAGIVSCVGRQAKELGMAGTTGYIQTDAAISSGSSGGPLVNLAGEVVGISTMRAMFTAGVSFAIPIDSAREIMGQMQQQGRVVRPYIGIKMLELNLQNTSQMHQRNSKFPTRSSGVLVPHVLAGSPACKAGLRQGDIIVGYGGNTKDVSVPALVEGLTQHIGKSLQLHVLRGEQQLDVTIRAIEARNDYPEAQ